MAPLVAIQCLVYNHESYLRQCLDGFIMQQTDFQFIAIVHDDASTDNSASIIREYQKKYPTIIKPIFEKENQYSKHDASISKIMNKVVNSFGVKYIAFCEGDDYWTDSNKLKRQVDFLEKHPEYSAIAENGLVKDNIKHIEYPISTLKSHDVSIEDALTRSRIQTVGVMCRVNAIDEFYISCKYHHDILIWCWLISRGKFRFSDTISSVYRKGNQGVTEYTPIYDFTREMENRRLEILKVFNVSKNFIYKRIISMYFFSAGGALKRGKVYQALRCGIRCIVYIFKLIFT